MTYEEAEIRAHDQLGLEETFHVGKSARLHGHAVLPLNVYRIRSLRTSEGLVVLYMKGLTCNTLRIVHPFFNATQAQEDTFVRLKCTK